MNSKKYLILNNNKLIYFFFYLIFFIYAVVISNNLSITSDAGFYVDLGRERIKYLLSLGQLKTNLTINQEAFPAIYLSIVGFFVEFSQKNLRYKFFI